MPSVAPQQGGGDKTGKSGNDKVTA
jgi:hypothetical protein